MSQDDEQEYQNSHRAFLQAFISKATFTFEEARPVLAAIWKIHDGGRPTLPEDVSQTDFENYVRIVNSAIAPFDMEIRSTWPQTGPRTRIWALVNTVSDNITQMSTTMSADEMAYVKRVLDCMFEKNNTTHREIMGAKRTQLLQLNRGGGGRASGAHVNNDGATAAETQGSSGGNLTAREAERVLTSLVDQDFFVRDGQFFTLSPRGLMELRQWLLETYNEPEDDGEPGVERIKACRACREIVTNGQRCDQKQCLARLHDHCVQGVFRAQRNETCCPICRTQWSGSSFVGKRADDTHSQARQSGARQSSGIRNDDDDMEEAESDTPMADDD